MLCLWITTSTWSAVTENSQPASMTSSPLFTSVAESIVIFLPIFQFGFFRASETVTVSSFSGLYP